MIHMKGKVIHFEIPADNLTRAQNFYKNTFGWQINAMPEMNYTMVGTTESDENGMPKAPGAINGGMTKRQAPVSAPVITIGVDDIDAALKTVEQNGGKTLVKKTDIGQNMGFTAYFKDSEGNIVGLYQNAQQQ